MIKEFYELAKQFLNLKVADIASKQEMPVEKTTLEKSNYQLTKRKKDTKSSLEGSNYQLTKRKKIQNLH